MRFLASLLTFAACTLAPVDAHAAERVLSRLTAAGTAFSDSTTETVLASYALPAYSLQPGKVYHLHGAVIATATNSTDTHTVVVRVGPTTLTGTVVGTSGAVDVADNGIVVVDLYLTVRDADGASNVIVSGFVSAAGVEGTVTARAAFEQLTTLDSGVAQRIELTGDWSVASASNSCRADAFILSEIT